MTPATQRIPPPRAPGRSIRPVWMALAALVLVAVFFAWGLPRDALLHRAERELEAMTAAEVTVGTLEPGLAWSGPGLRFEDVVLRWPGCLPVRLERVELFPTWSMAWLQGPVLRLALAGDLGGLEGTLRVHVRRGFRGALRGLDLHQLMAITTVWLMEGNLDADLDIVQDGLLPRGTARIHGRDGLIRIPKLVSPIVFDELEGMLRLGEPEAFVRIEDVRMESELASIRMEGSIGYAPVPEEAPLRLDGSITVPEPGVRNVMRLEGLTFDETGRGVFRVRGTVSLPVLE